MSVDGIVPSLFSRLSLAHASLSPTALFSEGSNKTQMESENEKRKWKAKMESEHGSENGSETETEN
jgi:hypothetical protein